jgi:hypothetical protein
MWCVCSFVFRLSFSLCHSTSLFLFSILRVSMYLSVSKWRKAIVDFVSWTTSKQVKGTSSTARVNLLQGKKTCRVSWSRTSLTLFACWQILLQLETAAWSYIFESHSTYHFSLSQEEVSWLYRESSIDRLVSFEWQNRERESSMTTSEWRETVSCSGLVSHVEYSGLIRRNMIPIVIVHLLFSFWMIGKISQSWTAFTSVTAVLLKIYVTSRKRVCEMQMHEVTFLYDEQHE